MAKISIIVPVYKTEKYLRRCVESILGQTYSDIELILVDDGSPDNCPAICDEYAQKDERIIVVHKENGGVSSARNTGLDRATGDYVAFVDSDDYIEPDMYGKMLGVATEHGCDVVLCDCIKDFPGYSSVYSHNIREGLYTEKQLKEEYYPHLLMMKNVEYPATISNCTMLVSRETVEGVRYPVGVRFSEDLLWGAMALYSAHSFFYMKGFSPYHYVMNEQSATHRFVPDKWRDYQKLYGEITRCFECCADFDFSHQIDLCLLFFVYNAVGEIYGAKLALSEKKRMIKNILSSPETRAMFRRTKVASLPISAKQRVITYLYKHELALGILCRYYAEK